MEGSVFKPLCGDTGVLSDRCFVDLASQRVATLCVPVAAFFSSNIVCIFQIISLSLCVRTCTVLDCMHGFRMHTCMQLCVSARVCVCAHVSLWGIY